MNLGSDDNRFFFFFGGVGGGAVFWREKEETDEMTGKKMSRLKRDIRKSTGWMKCRFLQKL